MRVKDAIEKRRAYRALKSIDIRENMISELIESVRLAPSCFNNQPWRFVFVYDKAVKDQLHSAMSRGNEWVFRSSMIVAVFSKEDDDCRIKGRNYYLFDTGIAAGFMILRATELGLVAHPIAGFDESKVREILGIPEEMTIITLLIVGEHSEEMTEEMSQKQIDQEHTRPERLPREEISYINRVI